ncbi:inorganic diphosphatase [Mongoliitalea daihaiensis]|uniref:inorganic diphosphatase n=1 Tax=Mongoliitalea daihaiensis TaxID=2782006 RepID=UPI001F1953BB|nr:inorganic diphosphatase [Mongoliitalea daihaiensis]UJP66571.1 inorganic diphosphatase [Mongoliitalea daihaiensis]
MPSLIFIHVFFVSWSDVVAWISLQTLIHNSPVSMSFYHLIFRIVVVLTSFMISVWSCSGSTDTKDNHQSVQNYLQDIPTYGLDSSINVVIEIPAGTNQKWEVNKATGQLEWEKLADASRRVVDYLAYPANYGFIPQTYLDPFKGGDGDPVDVFVLGEYIPRAEIVPSRIVGVIQLMDQGEIDDKLIAVPQTSDWNHIHTLNQLKDLYPGVLEILQIWLSNYKGEGKIEIQGIQDESVARVIIQQANRDYLRSKE